MRKSNTSVPCCSFDDSTAWLQQALFLGMLNNEERSAVLDATTRVLEFGFSEDIAAGVFGEFLEADQRSLSDG